MFLLQANTTSIISAAELQLIAPELILTACACVALIMEVILPYRKSKLTAYFSLVGVALAFISLAAQWWFMGNLLPDGFYGMVRIDGFALLFKAIFLVSAAFAIGISTRFLDIEGEQHGEYYALILFATVGMMFIACGYDLISLYISLELMAITFYVLVAFTKREKKSNEAAMKYFLLGAFSSGVLLYGMSLIYGIAGSTNIGTIATRFAEIVPQVQSAVGTEQPVAGLRPLMLFGMIALSAGLFFKVAAVPFHMWAPDVYEGAPTSVTAFLSTGSKAASFALYARIFSEALEPMRADWAPLLGLVAAITIMVGNWAAVTQENSKRLLAYSSISNAGYLLLALIAHNQYGRIGLIIYLFVYTLMNMGAFGVIISLRRRGIIGDNVDDMTGLAQKAPLMAAMMAIFMLSLGGLPFTGGFIGKFFLFYGLFERADADKKAWYYWLLGWAIINTVVSFYYYVRFIKVMYLGDRVADNKPLSLSPALQVALAVAVIGVIVVGVFPQPFIKLAQNLMP
ncbi:MAG TPA: NADH-quinone oxidoreductase subunit N [Pyrinomonadaceae bacterium]|nr:NADH-quinone oxidoreductase subunit N [Pyrinomonadaceae bacterium]